MVEEVVGEELGGEVRVVWIGFGDGGDGGCEDLGVVGGGAGSFGGFLVFILILKLEVVEEVGDGFFEAVIGESFPGWLTEEVYEEVVGFVARVCVGGVCG